MSKEHSGNRFQNRKETQIGRRRWIGWLIGTTVAAGVGAVGLCPNTENNAKEPVKNAKTLLQEWEEDVKKNPEKRASYTPKIVDLALDVFSQEMGYSKIF